jgi:hypothetical protein
MNIGRVRVAAVAAAALLWLGLGAVPAQAQFDFSLGFAVTRCVHDGEIADEERVAIQRAGLDFAVESLGDTPEAAYEMLAADARKALARDDFLAVARRARSFSGPLRNTRVQRTLLLTGSGQKITMWLPCGTYDPAEGKVSVIAKPLPKQAYAIIEGDAGPLGLSIVVWLVPEPEWHVLHFQYGLTELAGRSAGDLRRAAEEERDKGHAFNAAMLYDWAGVLADRGPNLRLALKSDIQADAAAMTPPRPEELKGHVPYAWSLGGQAFIISEIGLYDLDGALCLKLVQDIDPWTDDADADQHNRTLVQAFAAAFPEYTSAFAGLVVFARDVKGNRVFRTLDRHG